MTICLSLFTTRGMITKPRVFLFFFLFFNLKRYLAMATKRFIRRFDKNLIKN